MTTIKVTKHTRKLIEKYRLEGESINDAIERLIKSSQPLPIEDRGVTNIHLSEETFNMLKSYKAYPTQSHSDTLLDLLKRAK